MLSTWCSWFSTDDFWVLPNKHAHVCSLGNRGSNLSESRTFFSPIIDRIETSLQSNQFSSVRLFAVPWIAAHQASLSFTGSWSLPKFMSIESVMPSSYLILCRPLLLLPLIPPSIRVFSNESALRMRWPKYWSFSFSIRPSTPRTDLF